MYEWINAIMQELRKETGVVLRYARKAQNVGHWVCSPLTVGSIPDPEGLRVSFHVVLS